jgi:hypothetical protein
MERSDGQLVLVGGVVLLTLSLLGGFLIAVLPLPGLALSAHLVGLMGATLLIALGAAWPSLVTEGRASRAAAWLSIYSFGGGWLVYLGRLLPGQDARYRWLAVRPTTPDSRPSSPWPCSASPRRC